jgi:hypothetical protein
MAVLLDVTAPERTAEAYGDELVAEAAALVDTLQAPVIVDRAGLERVVGARTRLAEALARVVAYFAPLKAMAYKLHRAICDREAAIRAPLDRLDAQYRTAIADFKAAEDRERRAQEVAIAEAQRVAREADAAREAAALESQGEHALAAAVVAEAISAPAPVVALPDVTQGIDGLTFTRRWHWRYAGGPADVKDTPPHLVARALDLVPREFLMIDEKKLGQYVRAMKASARIPGIECYETVDPVRR